MLTALIIMTLLVGIFLGIAGTGGALVILVKREESKKNPYTESIARGKMRAERDMAQRPTPGPILN